VKTYIGSKIIQAEVMDECSFLREVKGQDVENRETTAGYKAVYPDGYVSWSPKKEFFKCLQRTCLIMFIEKLLTVRKN
jgi:hypothetical protein